LLLVGYFKVGELEIRENFLTFLLEAVWSYSDTTSGVYPKTAPDPRGTHCANYDPAKLEMEKTPSLVRIYSYR
jgi:hypothetical protein